MILGLHPKQVFPLAIIVMDCGASLGYLLCRDYRHAIYWFAAAVLTTSVTF